PRTFTWFVEGDFIKSLSQQVADIGFLAYVILAALYVSKELYYWRASRFINVPKNLIIASTALSWWVGIISVNSDLAFTMTNVLSHGIPYMALVWLYNGRAVAPPASTDKRQLAHSVPLLFPVVVFLLVLVTLAYLEEGLWAGLVWREHLSVFRPFIGLPTL